MFSYKFPDHVIVANCRHDVIPGNFKQINHSPRDKYNSNVSHTEYYLRGKVDLVGASTVPLT